MYWHFLSIKRIYLNAIVLAAAALISGCGSGGNSSTKSSQEGTGASSGGEVSVEAGSLSKAQFITQADKMCETSRKHLEREYAAYLRTPSSTSESSSDTQTRVVNTILIPTYNSLVDRLVSLGTPSGDEAEITDFVRAIQAGLTEADAQPSKVFEERSPFSQAVKLAMAYGLTGCAKSLS